MNKNDMKNPLIQSGIILLIIFLLIAIVANAEPHGFMGSIGALASGILFFIGLILAIAISIAIILGLFIAAVSIHSVDKARDLTGQLKQVAASLYEKIGKAPQTTPATSHQHTEDAPPAVPLMTEQLQHLSTSLDFLQSMVNRQQQHIEGLARQLEQVEQRLGELSLSIDNQPEDEQLEASRLLTGKMADQQTTLNQVMKRLQDLETSVAAEQGRLAEELDTLRTKASLPERISGVLSYIERPEDRDIVTAKAREAVSRGLTYSQIDELFKTSLKPAIYAILNDHPRLTKDLIRSVRKQFS